jgi:twitching motility protein PilT
MSDIAGLLELMVARNATDLHLKVGSPPRLRVAGDLAPLADTDTLKPNDTAALAHQIVPGDRVGDLDRHSEVDFAHSVPGLGRFRVTVYLQRGSIGLVLRRVLPGVPTIESLRLPAVARQLAEAPRGLVLVAGPGGSGKTATLAALVDHVNATQAVNIITIEDPIEILHTDKRGVVNQREVGSDVADVASALRRLTKLDPDVVLVSELHDPDTVWAAIRSADSHLVFSSMNTTSALETLNRLIEFFPGSQSRQVRLSIASALRGVICQRLVPAADGKSRVPAVEALVMTGRIRERIIDPARMETINTVLAEGRYYGMQTLDQHLLELYQEGVIDFQAAMEHAMRPHDFKLALKQAELISHHL